MTQKLFSNGRAYWTEDEHGEVFVRIANKGISVVTDYVLKHSMPPQTLNEVLYVHPEVLVRALANCKREHLDAGILAAAADSKTSNALDELRRALNNDTEEEWPQEEEEEEPEASNGGQTISRGRRGFKKAVAAINRIDAASFAVGVAAAREAIANAKYDMLKARDLDITHLNVNLIPVKGPWL